MAAQRIVLSLALAIGSVGALQSAAFAQEYQGTWEQQMACTPDVWRLCGDQVPDVGRIVACSNHRQMRSNSSRADGCGNSKWCRAAAQHPRYSRSRCSRGPIKTMTN